MPACRNRKVVMSQLVNPVVRIDFHLISSRGRELPPGARGVHFVPQELHCHLGGPRGYLE
jgi:hypothetical protein